MDMIRINKCNELHKKMGGMTLIELMIAVVIVGVLASIAYPTYSHYVKEGHRRQVMADMAKIQLYLEENYRHSEGYPIDEIFDNNSVCSFCDYDNERFELTIKSINDNRQYTIIAKPLLQRGQNTDTCRGEQYDQLELKSNGEALPRACW
ncbi:MAG: type IV pilin protein [Vibrio metschnikovii]|nr:MULTISPECIES: type IV pilin protein [Vibrio]EKO3589885.1 type IV pilin protein [Vibrio metschnikovii]EKO3666563.1 type IV pilin protein [Vibrio metschnikovii]EKO3697072.1 type IV pilin protein [Vibrio metschnikovii]EKO3718181.1 type IV pilin protein [Vibrio metschnikovii]EKO3734085.1 type IV pilin protein [Vibrio metschnikovii]